MGLFGGPRYHNVISSFLTMPNDTIVALAGAANQAIAIVRLSGENAKSIADKVLEKSIVAQNSHSILHNYIVEDKKRIDEVLVSYFQAPASYTGEDMIEINIHGGSYLCFKVVSLLITKGARLALAGEFSRRAFLNAKKDLAQVEAVNDLVLAQSAYSAQKAMDGLNGATAALINPLKEELQKLAMEIAVNIDYPEYDENRDIDDKILVPKIKEWLLQSEKIIENSQKNLLHKDGIMTLIIGEPNVGKSSLLNALVNKKRALVSETPGTTRDYIEAEVIIEGIHLCLIDTAGLRDKADSLEEQGILKTQELLQQAQLVIMVLDATKRLSEQEKQLINKLKGRPAIIVANKSDLADSEYPIKISALNNDLKPLLKEIKRLYNQEALTAINTLNSHRQLSLLMQANQALKEALKSLEEQRELELVAIDIDLAYEKLSDILGRVSRVDLLDQIFKDFCLGK